MLLDEYCIYLRKSRKDVEAEARGEGETLVRHERALLELAQRQSLNVTQIYREIVSGDTIAARPVMQQVLSEVEQGMWTGVLVMEIERLARGATIDQGIIAQTFKYSGTKIVTPLKTYDPENEYDEEYFEFGLFMSRREYKAINRRLQRGKFASTQEGKWLPGKAPYGYVRQKLINEKGWTLRPDESTADVVRMIFSLYAYGLKLGNGTIKQMSILAIAYYLEDIGAPPPGGTKWHAASVARILENPVYIGKVTWTERVSKQRVYRKHEVRKPRTKNDKVHIFDGRHPPLVSDETFKRVSELRKQSARPCRPVDAALQNPFHGLIYCPYCGKTLVRRVVTNAPHRSYLRCRTRGCQTVNVRISVVEQRVLQGLKSWLGGYELNLTASSASPSLSNSDIKKKALVQANNEVKRLNKQMEKAYELLEQGIYDTDTFLSRKQTLSCKVSSAKARIEQLSKELGAEIELDSRRRELVPKVKSLLKAYRGLKSPEDKNVMLKEIIEKIVIRRISPSGKKLAQDDFELEIYPRLPKRETH